MCDRFFRPDARCRLFFGACRDGQAEPLGVQTSACRAVRPWWLCAVATLHSIV